MIFITNKYIMYSQICPNEMKNSSTHWLIWRLNRSVDYCCNEDSLFLKSLLSHLLDILRLLNRLGWEAFIHTESFSTEHVDCFFLHALGNLFVSYRARYTRWENVVTIFHWSLQGNVSTNWYGQVSQSCRTCTLDIQYQQNQLLPILYGFGTPSHICLT